MTFFPFAPTVLNLLHKVHVIESFSSLFSNGHGYCLRYDGANKTMAIRFCAPSLGFSVDSVDINCCLGPENYEKLSSVFVRNRCLYAEKKNIMLVL